MLKALELSGFKSFAEKTKFSFPPAITVIVGPNGSGKSNVVDAIKWVLGTQSVKSLRGKEMTDVIFNGSGTRQPMNTAEVTLTFDNTQRRLAIDTSDVAITRRVYRSGEGEYLINRQPCRLRDIRDLFSGTGIATDAYSIIEQGKVDVMLQSSPRDRRAIFEEAAGISRFKGKKLEAERRLERVDQNLLRLSDIVDEVESRLRSIRMQAAKARRYREHSNRLRALRTHVGLTDWRALSESLAAHQQQLTARTSRRDERGAKLELAEAEVLGLETAIGQWEEKILSGDAQVHRDRELIVAAEAAIEHEWSRCRELDDEIRRHRRQLAEMNTRAGDLQQQFHATQAAWEAVHHEYEEVRGRLEGDEQSAGELAARLREGQRATSEHRDQHVALMREAAAYGNEISAAKSRETSAAEVCLRCAEQAEGLARDQQSTAETLAAARTQLAAVEGELAGCTEQVRAGRTELAATRAELTRTERARGELEQRRTAANERAAVLTELERRLEGLGSGVKQVLAKARQANSGPYRHIRGLLADLVHVKVDTASLIEAALGPLAEYLVLAPGQAAVAALIEQSGSLHGRVGLLRVDAPRWTDDVHVPDLGSREGVIGRADRFVQTAPEYVPLIHRLLGHTFLVETLDHALTLADAFPRGLCFVTRQGEVVVGPGRLLVGPQHTATGLISRRSELRALSEEIHALDQQLAAASGEVGDFETRLAEQERDLAELDQRHSHATREASHWRLQTASAEQRAEQLESQRSLLAREAEAAADQRQAALAQADAAQQRLTLTERQLVELEAQLRSDAATCDALADEYAQRQQGLTASQVELAKSEQRLDGLSQQRDQLQRDQDERQQGLTEHRGQLGRCQQRITEAQREILRLESELAERYLHREEVVVAVIAHRNGREMARAQRGEYRAQGQTIREELRTLEKQIHAEELEADRVTHQREALAERMLEDYGIELNALEEDSDEEARGERQEVEQEIADLRRKLNRIGSVNLEALDELDALETRFNSLSTQYNDLEKAKAALEQIITKINVDSRRLFAATIAEVRGHFQGLFRKLFGGGQADIVVEEGEGVDILEGGIEIVARPPGKEPRNISLLSGGEKTLTCVALLMAIFRSRPSPFCVLDEVDAALDEANIERFTGVLTEFLASTQFLVVTHSKKTMTAANTLYGITMQESGVSKRVSVRFDDVSDNGEIRESALSNETETQVEVSAEQADDDTQAA